MKPKVLFFARDYHAEFMVFLKSEKYEPIFITLTTKEKNKIEKKGFKVSGCFEEEFDSLPVSDLPENYLESSFSSDRYLRYTTIADRRRILQKEISFWSRILDQYSPSLIVNETVAIEVSEVLYLEGKKRNIRYSAWMAISLKNHFYWQTSPMHNSMDPAIFEATPDKLSVEKAEQYMAQVQDGKGKPFYAINMRSRYSLYLLLRNCYWLLRCYLTEHKYSDKAKNLLLLGDNAYLYKERITAFFKSFFFKYDDLKDYTNYEKVFYPLHYEPEAVLFYMAEFYDNQIASMENMAKCLKHNQVLVVKEHPQQPGILLQNKFREAKKRIPNLVFLPGEYSTYHLILQSKLVVTLTSTAGIEALILGKPVVVLGRVFYDRYEGVNLINNYEALRHFIREEKSWNFPKPLSLKLFLSQIIAHSKQGNPFPPSDLYAEQNIKNIVEAIESELDKELDKVALT